jgi:putative transposase
MHSVESLAVTVGVQSACAALGVPRSSLYATRRLRPVMVTRPRLPPSNALSVPEKTAVVVELNSDRFADQTPYEVYPQLLDEGRYLCSLRSMYRLLAENQAVCDRRNQRRHPARPAPQVIAHRPNQVWVWDITRLPSIVQYQCFYLYLVLDLFSRFIVGWLIAEKQSGDYAEHLLATSFKRFHLQPAQLTVHSDNGGPMIAKPVTWLFSELGIQPSLSRPHIANDNPHAEAGFKTLKYTAHGHKPRFFFQRIG